MEVDADYYIEARARADAKPADTPGWGAVAAWLWRK